MSVANPYIIHVELFWPNGTRPNQNEIARVRAYDVNGEVVTDQGQSGFNPSNGTWQDLVLQNIAAVYPPRLHPNLKLQVESTSEQVLHVTRVFPDIVSESTVKIVIGESDHLVGTWEVSGTVLDADGNPAVAGQVEICDVTAGSAALLGTSVPDPSGAYSVSFTIDSFQNNGEPHTSPNLVAKFFDADGQLVAQSERIEEAGQQTVIHLNTGDVSQSGDYSVRGRLTNELGLPVAGVLVEAYNVQWTIKGIEETVLGVTTTDGKGDYEILYSPAYSSNPDSECGEGGASSGTVNLNVYAKGGTVAEPTELLAKGPTVFDATQFEVVDLEVDKVAAVATSEYQELHGKLWGCLGRSESEKWDTINALAERPDHREFIARSLGISAELVAVYVEAWRINGRINDTINWSTVGAPIIYDKFDPEVIYGLLRVTGHSTLEQLLEIEPSSFYDAMVEGLNTGLISQSIEERLDVGAEKPLQEQWKLVLAHFLAVDDLQNPAWQTDLLKLVLSDEAKRAEVAAAFYDYEGPFEDFLLNLVPGTLTAQQAEDLNFAFDAYEAVDQYLPIVQTLITHKLAQGWTSIADLATVPLNDDKSGNSWTTYAGQQSNIAGTFPGDIPGKNASEKTEVYARRLDDLFGAAEPQVRFSQAAAEDAAATGDSALAEAASFMSENEDFVLTTTPIDKYIRDNGLNVSDAGLAALKQQQRVARLSTDYEVGKALVAAKLDSAIAISRQDEDQFVADHEELLGSLTVARCVHRKATLYASEIYSTLVRFNPNLNDVGGSGAIPAAANLQTLAESVGSAENPDKFPNWVTLFGGLNSCASKQCQTVLSAGAYLADLLQWIDGAPKNLLFERRRDLVDIELTCPNTDKVLPYIDLAIEVLESVVSPQQVPAFSVPPAPGPFTRQELDAASDGDAVATTSILGHLAAAGYTLTSLAVVKRSAVDALEGDDREWVIEDDAWRFTLAQPSATPDSGIIAQAAPQTSVSNEQLDVFPEHSNPAANAALENAVFPFQLPLSLGREEVELVVEQQGVTRADVLEVFRTGRASDGSDLGVETVLNDPAIARSYLKLTIGEEQAVVGQGRPIREFWGFNDLADDDVQVEIRRPESPHISVTGTWKELMGEMSVFLHRSQLSYKETLELLDTEFVHNPSARITIVADDEDALSCNYNQFQLANIGAEGTLERLSFFLRLKRTLGWESRELDRYLMTVGQADKLSNWGVPGDLVRVAQLVRFCQDYRLKSSEGLGLWLDLDYRRTERFPKSIFDGVYLRGAPSSGEFQAIEGLLQLHIQSVDQNNPPPSIELEHPGSPQTSEEGFKNYVKGALGLGVSELDALWPRVVSGTTISYAQLSLLARIARFSALAGITIDDYFRLFNHGDMEGLLGLAALPSFDDSSVGERIVASFVALEEADRQEKTGLYVAELDYLLRHRESDGERQGPGDDALLTVYQSLTEASKSVFERYPVVELPDSEVNGQLLSEVMPATRIPRILEALRWDNLAETPTPPSGEQAYFERYFEVFMGESTTSKVNQLLNDVTLDEAGRHLLIWDDLRNYLVENAKVEAALSTAATVTGANRELVDRLLNTVLTTVEAGSNEPGMRDWTSALSGWDTGHETLEDVGAGSYGAQWIVPADDTYIFVLSVNEGDSASVVPTDFTLSVDGRLLENPEVSTEGGRTQLTYPASPEALKSGSAGSLLVTNEHGSQRLTLLVRSGNNDPAVIPTSQLSPFKSDALTKLQKALLFRAGLKLSENELNYLISKTDVLDRFPLAAEPASEVAWSEVEWFFDQLALNRSIKLDDSTLFDEWQNTKEPLMDDAARVAQLTGWQENDVQTLLDSLWPADAQPPVELMAPEVWFVLSPCMASLQKLGLSATQVMELLVNSAPSVRVAGILRDSLRSSYSDDAWRENFKPLRDQLRQTHRDALVGYLTTRELTIGSEEVNFFDANDLYAYLLIDVQMEPDTLLSRIKLALNSVQLFVQRVFMGLESKRALFQLDRKKSQWTWMKNYRVWEANRKVFLYPENWIEPELRDDKSELFSELEEQLQQGEVTGERAVQALSGFIEGLDELAHLKVVAACTEGVFSAGRTSTLHIVGRTRAAPYTYYHRTFEGRQFADGVFSPWRKVDLEIAHESVAPVIINGSLHLFWPLIQEKEKVANDPYAKSSNDDEAVDASILGPQVEIRFLWSALIPETGNWSKPRLGKSKIIDTSISNVLNRAAEDDGPDTSVYHFRTAEERGSALVEVIKTPSVFGERRPLGTFRVDPFGQESIVPPTESLATVGGNAVQGTLINWNVASSSQSTRQFEFVSSKPFFWKVEHFDSLVTNMGYYGEAQNQPFFFETSTDSLMALHRDTSRSPGFAPGLSQVANFQTFGHPVLGEVKKRYRAQGPAGIMNRLTQALPTSDGRYYYNLSGSRLSSSAGSYTSGYANHYNYYGGVYLGYHIARDRMAWGVSQRDFEGKYHPSSTTVERHYPLPTVEFAYGSSYGAYNWELFFHMPLLIADRLTQEMRFEEAMEWYHHVFDPRQDLNNYEKTKRWALSLPAGARYWNFLPFFANRDATDSLLDSFGVTESLTKYEKESLATVITEWRNDPFNPHLIARQRIVAYQKSTVMKYLDNLIAWGDQLFRRDTFESINEATQLYVLAAEILGERPEVIEPVVKEPRYTYRELKAIGLGDFSNALVEVENLLVANSEHVKGEEVDRATEEHQIVQATALQSLYFRIPRNSHLDQYWDTVQDRLFKIRNSMNIDGVKRTLALFAPPIDPALLVKAAALGIDLSTAISRLGRAQPHYRFRVWSQKAMDLVNEVKSFGGALLSALEKQDAEELAQLRQTHELRLLNLSSEVRRSQIAEAEASIEALEASKLMAEDRLEEFTNREFRNSPENLSVAMTTTSGVLDTVAGVMDSVAGVLALIPEAEVGFVGAKIQFGGNNLNNSLRGIGSAIRAGSTVTRTIGANAATLGQHQRRQEDWDHQADQAELEIEQIEKQIAAAQIRLAIAQTELANHEVQIEQSLEVQEFLQGKFSNRELYKWMNTELSRTYRQVYNLAYDVARTAEQTYRFELGIKDSDFIQFGYMDGRYKGLLAGEKLAYDLKRMDVAYLEHDKREFEITKPVSLLSLNPQAVQQLREKGFCEFDVPETVFDLDFPGQYFRRLQAVRLTIPCVTGPYTSVSAKLSQTRSAIRVQGTASGDYAYQGFEDTRFVHRVGNIQSIATSTAQDDAGVFELNFNDERYLPFEGTGAVSRWRLELPTEGRQFDYHTISDVIMSLSYTARDAGGAMKVAVENNLRELLNGMLSTVVSEGTQLSRVFSMKREFPDSLHQLLSTKATSLSIIQEHFPYLYRERRYQLVPLDVHGEALQMDIHLLGKGVPSDDPSVTFALNENSPSDSVIFGGAETAPNVRVESVARDENNEDIVPGGSPEFWHLTQENMSPETVDDILIVLKYTLKDSL